MSTPKNKEESAQAIADKVQESTAQFHQWFEPQWNSRADVLKTIVSLSSGAIVLTVAFSSSLREIQAASVWRYLIVFSFAMFITSLVLAFIGLWIGTRLYEMQSSVFNKRKEIIKALMDAATREDFNESFNKILMNILKPIARSDRTANWLFWISSSCFCLAVTSLAIVGIVQVLPKIPIR